MSFIPEIWQRKKEVHTGRAGQMANFLPVRWLMVMKKTSNRNNLLVIEFKKKNAETYDKENDRNKLMYLTDQKEDFKYNFGLFVELGSHEVYMEVYQEGNLQTKLNYSITY